MSDIPDIPEVLGQTPASLLSGHDVRISQQSKEVDHRILQARVSERDSALGAGLLLADESALDPATTNK
eukprot:9818343-Heterocapsa_arctica.AAC.1